MSLNLRRSNDIIECRNLLYTIEFTQNTPGKYRPTAIKKYHPVCTHVYCCVHVQAYDERLISSLLNFPTLYTPFRMSEINCPPILTDARIIFASLTIPVFFFPTCSTPYGGRARQGYGVLIGRGPNRFERLFFLISYVNIFTSSRFCRKSRAAYNGR